MKAAVDTSVLIAFGKLGHLGLLTRLFDGLFLAKSVLDEVRGSEIYAEVERLMDVGSASVAEASNRELLGMLSSGLIFAETRALSTNVALIAVGATMVGLMLMTTAIILWVTISVIRER